MTDETIVTLSTGTQVKFNKMPAGEAQDLVIELMEKISLTETGEIITTDMTLEDQVEFAQVVQTAHDKILIAGMLSPDNPPVALVSKLPTNDMWLKVLLMRKDVREKLSAFTVEQITKDKTIKTFLFLRYMAFKTQEDWELITTKTLL